MRQFVGRKKEVTSINRLLNSSKAELIIIYGKKRLGKTSLIKHVLKKKKAMYFLATKENLIINLRRFQKEFSVLLQQEFITHLDVMSFVDLFRTIAQILPKEYIIAIDELPYLIEHDSSIVSQLQKIYDEYLEPKSIKLILCGSSKSIMSDLMNYSSPLYGRRTASLQLRPFTFYETYLYFQKDKDLKKIMKHHLIFGGVPYYLKQINQEENFISNIEHLFFDNTSIFIDEIEFLLKSEFREIGNYLSILTAISNGKNTFSMIADITYIEKGSLSKYLKSLELLGFIEKRYSFFDKVNSKKSLYIITDQFIYFYYYSIHNKINSLNPSLSQMKQFHDNTKRCLGKLFEQECINIMKNIFIKVGSYFRDGIEIDIIGKEENVLTCFECKFQDNINNEKILDSLDKKIAHLPESYIYKKRIISVKDDINLIRLLEISKNIYDKKEVIL